MTCGHETKANRRSRTDKARSLMEYLVAYQEIHVRVHTICWVGTWVMGSPSRLVSLHAKVTRISRASLFIIKTRQPGSPDSHIHILASGMNSQSFARTIDHNIARLLNTHYSPTEYDQVLECLFEESAHHSKQQNHNQDLDLVRAALEARMEMTSILEKHTALRFVVARRIKKCLHHLRRIRNITREQIREKLGEDIYSDLVDEEMLSAIIERKVVASRNKNRLEERFWATNAKMMEPEYLRYQELGELVKEMLIKEADDEGSCEQLLIMEQTNREMLLSWLCVMGVNICQELG